MASGCVRHTSKLQTPAAPVAFPADLPNSSQELLDLATRILEQGSSIDEFVRAVAALEKIASGQTVGTNPSAPFEVDFRLAKACYLIAELEPNAERRAAWLRQGETVAEQARKARPDRVEGPYFLAVIIGRKAEALGLAALVLVRRIEELSLEAMKLDPTYENGGPYRLLAMVYAKAPAWPASIGDPDRALELAQEAVATVDYPLNRYILAEVLIEVGETAKARKQLRAVLSAPKVGKWAQEGETWRPRARKLLDSLTD